MHGRLSTLCSCTDYLLCMWCYCEIGAIEYESIRPLSYPGTDVFIVCYDIFNPTSFESVIDKVGAYKHTSVRDCCLQPFI
jgi:hypothetical protein